jgi:two-component system chemotaxis sensor kinase CheA
MGFTNQDISEFRTECLDMLDLAEKSLLALDAHGDFTRAYPELFRTFHSLKGASAMMEMTALQTHLHQLENLLVHFKGSFSIPKEYCELFLKGIDAARGILDGQELKFNYKPADTNSPPDTTPVEKLEVAVSDSALSEFISECEEISERVSLNFRLVEKGDTSSELVNSIYRDIHSLKGSSQLFGFVQLGDLVHAMESCLEPVREKKATLNLATVDLLFKCMDLVEKMVAAIKAKNKIDYKSEVETWVAALLKSDQKSVSPPPASAPTSSAPEVAHTEADSASTIRVSVSLLDQLMALMGEMVLVRNQVLQYSSRSDDLEFLNLSQRLNIITGDLQTNMMKTRMQPVGTVLNKFHRVVRDVSKELGKDIELTLVGAETELDKTLLEAVKDPLTHILRNSCDHGIETPQQRQEAGKVAKGSIVIRSYHEGGQVIIEVTDDGKGLHRQKLITKAIEKGLISAEKSAIMSDRDVFNLIFAAGFSTAASVTNLSGRGVGMDVVRNNIDHIGGSVELKSEPGKGMTTRLKIPLTLAIIPAMIVRCGVDRYAIPQVKLVELVRVEPDSALHKIEYLQGKPIYRLRGNLLPLIDLKTVFKYPNENGAVEKPVEAINIVVLNAESNYFGLIVEEIQDTADIVVKPLSRFLKALSIYSGATVLGDGSVALIIDVLGMAHQQNMIGERKEEANSRGVATAKGREAPVAREYLLFKIDSPTKHAILLQYVHRLEEFKASAIEYSGTQKVVRYRNSILPIISLNSCLNYQRRRPDIAPETISIIVTQRGDRLLGIEVDEIYDVLSTEAQLDASVKDRAGIAGNLATPDEVIVVVDPHAIAAQMESKVLHLHPIASQNSFAELAAVTTQSLAEHLVQGKKAG